MGTRTRAAVRSMDIRTLSWLSGFLLLVVLVLLNAVFARASVRWDLTESGIYTLSDGARRMLGSLGAPAQIRVFWNNVPGPVEGQRRYLDALLQEMESAAGGRLRVRWVGGLDSEQGKKEAADAGVEEQDFTAFVPGELRATRGYATVVVDAGGERKQVPNIINERSRLEYLILKALHEALRPQGRGVGLVTPGAGGFARLHGAGFGRFNLLERRLRELLGRSLRSGLSLDEPVPPDVDVLVVAAPEKLPEREVYHLDQFVLRGGRLFLLLDPWHWENLEAFAREPASSGLEEWLAHVGVKVGDEIAGDQERNLTYPRKAPGARGYLPVHDYPWWPVSLAEDLDQGNPATRGWRYLPLYWPAPVSLDHARLAEGGREGRVLATTSASGVTRPSGFDVLTHVSKAAAADLHRVPLMVVVEGQLASMWKGRPAPGEGPDDDDDGEGEGEEADEAGEGVVVAPPPPGRGQGGDPWDLDASGEVPQRTEATDEDGTDGEAPREDAEEAEDPEEAETEGAGEADASSGDRTEEVAPAPPAAPLFPGEANAQGRAEGATTGPPRLEEGRGVIVVIGDAELASDFTEPLLGWGLRLGQQLPYHFGLEFVQNVVDWLTGSDALLSIRARTGATPQIEDVASGKRELLIWANILGMPLLLFLAGLVVFIVRRYQTT